MRVPASTANLGPGFDTLRMALSPYNEVELADEGEGLQLLTLSRLALLLMGLTADRTSPYRSKDMLYGLRT